jgi:hypothetical protein
MVLAVGAALGFAVVSLPAVTAKFASLVIWLVMLPFVAVARKLRRPSRFGARAAIVLCAAAVVIVVSAFYLPLENHRYVYLPVFGLLVLYGLVCEIRAFCSPLRFAERANQAHQNS